MMQNNFISTRYHKLKENHKIIPDFIKFGADKYYYSI